MHLYSSQHAGAFTRDHAKYNYASQHTFERHSASSYAAAGAPGAYQDCPEQGPRRVAQGSSQGQLHLQAAAEQRPSQP